MGHKYKFHTHVKTYISTFTICPFVFASYTSELFSMTAVWWIIGWIIHWKICEISQKCSSKCYWIAFSICSCISVKSRVSGFLLSYLGRMGKYLLDCSFLMDSWILKISRLPNKAKQVNFQSQGKGRIPLSLSDD